MPKLAIKRNDWYLNKKNGSMVFNLTIRKDTKCSQLYFVVPNGRLMSTDTNSSRQQGPFGRFRFLMRK